MLCGFNKGTFSTKLRASWFKKIDCAILMKIASPISWEKVIMAIPIDMSFEFRTVCAAMKGVEIPVPAPIPSRMRDGIQIVLGEDNLKVVIKAIPVTTKRLAGTMTDL